MTRMEFPETVLDDFPVDELLHSAHPREMLPLFRPDVPRGGPLFNPREHKQLFFSVNPYEKPRDSFLVRFWTQEQAIYYARVLLNKERIYQHLYMDMPSLYSTTCFQNMTETIDELHAQHMFVLKSRYNSEPIKQFYSMLYVSG